MDHSSSHYTNQFVPTNVHDSSKVSVETSSDQNEQFKQYYKNRKTRENRDDFHQHIRENPNSNRDMLSKIPQHILTKQDHKFRKYVNNDLMSTNRVDFETTEPDFDYKVDPEEITDKFRYIKPISTTVSVDSRNRDKSTYPRPNSYRVLLPRNFHNVKRISLRSTSFPNPSQLIRDTPAQQANNNLYWQDDNASTTIFNAVITPGNYTASLLASEIENKMNQIPRDDGEPHNFKVSIDQVTDIVSISSFKVVSANNVMNLDTGNPFTVTIDLSPNEHGFLTGDTIEVAGAFSSGGVPSNELNGVKGITVLDLNRFTYQLSSSFPVTVDVSDTGGTMSFSKGLDFKLFFDETDYPNTIANVLAFPLVNTDFASEHVNTVVKQAFPIKQMYSIDSTYTAVVIDASSEIVVGTEIRFHGITEFSPSVNSLLSDGVGYLLIDLPPADELVLQTLYKADVSDCKAFKIALDTSATVTSNQLSSSIQIDGYIELSADSFAVRMVPTYPIITGFYPYNIGPSNYVAVEFDGPHGFQTGDTVCIPELPSFTYIVSELSPSDITELQSSGDMNYNVFNTLTVFDSYLRISETVPYEAFYRQVTPPIQVLTEPYPLGYMLPIPTGSRGSPPPVSGTYLSFNEPIQTTEGYTVLPITVSDQATLDSLALADPALDITVQFKLSVPEGTTTASLGSNGYLTYGQYMFTRTNNKRVILSGDPYIFMTSPSLETIFSIGEVENIFAKLQLASSASDVIYNSFISSPYVLEDSPIPNINEFDVSFRYFDNSLVNFNDIDHSFCIEIVEYHDKLRYNHFDSRRGRYDDIRIRQDYY